jgi:hypothetical protein
VPEDGSSIAGWMQGGDFRTSKLSFVWHHGWYHVIVRIVLDTASFVTAVRSSVGAAGEVVRMIFREGLVPLMDLKLGLEYRDVALRSEHVGASALSKREILELIEAMESFSEPVEVVIKVRPLSPDPNDDMQHEAFCGGREEVWTSGAFSGGTVSKNEGRKPRWRLKLVSPQSQSSHCD